MNEKNIEIAPWFMAPVKFQVPIAGQSNRIQLMITSTSDIYPSPGQVDRSVGHNCSHLPQHNTQKHPVSFLSFSHILSSVQPGYRNMKQHIMLFLSFMVK